MQQQEIFLPSSLDGSMQPFLFYRAPSGDRRPLLVGLHTWSYDRSNQIGNLLPYAQAQDFNLLLPEFRGPNLASNPHCRQACGSELAKRDIVDALDWAVTQEYVDADNVFLLGLSGGGHMALLMAGHCPHRFRCVSAFVPISDLSCWAEENPGYAPNILACCGGSREEMAQRSPVCYLDGLARSNTKIFHGKFDPVVPVSQSLKLYAALMERHPDCSVYLDIFDGGHEMDLTLAAHWIASQYGEKKKIAVTG